MDADIRDVFDEVTLAEVRQALFNFFTRDDGLNCVSS